MCACAKTLVFISWHVYFWHNVCVWGGEGGAFVFVCSFTGCTAALDLQLTFDPVLCGGSDLLHTVMASVLQLRQQPNERAQREQPWQIGGGDRGAD